MSGARIVDLEKLGVDIDTFDKIYSMGEEDGRADAIEEFCKQYKNFQSDEGICDLQEDCSISGGWCIDCFKDKWLKEQK